MPRRTGFSDSLIDSRLNWLIGTTYPVAPTQLFISLLSGIPGSDGSNVVELSARAGPVTFSAPASQAGDGGWPHTRSVQPSAPVSVTPNGSASPPTYLAGACFAVWSASSGGNPIYIGALSWRYQAGVAVSIPASELAIYGAESV